jgi:DNA-binding PadR family transcriptional regulator
MSEKLAWDWDFVVLQPLSHGKPTHLKDIYAAIEERRGKGGINAKLFKVDGRWGDRRDYTHSVRSTMDSLRKRGMVEHLGKGRTGMYQITNAGQKRLTEIEP